MSGIVSMAMLTIDPSVTHGKSTLIRYSPVIMPLLACVAAVIGFSVHSHRFPGVDNVFFVVVACTISGIVPLCCLVGVPYSFIDNSKRVRHAMVIGYFVLCVAIAIGSYFYGANIVF